MQFSFRDSGDQEVELLLGEEIVPKKESFKYLGSFLQSDGGMDREVEH